MRVFLVIFLHEEIGSLISLEEAFVDNEFDRKYLNESVVLIKTKMTATKLTHLILDHTDKDEFILTRLDDKKTNALLEPDLFHWIGL